jgi:hypothetical protein
MLKYLRIAVTALILTACVLLVALCVRSYQWTDSVRWADNHKYGLWVLSSDYGTLMLLRNPEYRADRPGGWGVGSYQIDEGDRRSNPPPRFAWWFNRHNGNLTIRTPHWLLVAAGMVLAMMPWIRLRFSLRTLLIATMLVAISFGIIVVMW